MTTEIETDEEKREYPAPSLSCIAYANLNTRRAETWICLYVRKMPVQQAAAFLNVTIGTIYERMTVAGPVMDEALMEIFGTSDVENIPSKIGHLLILADNDPLEMALNAYRIRATRKGKTKKNEGK